MSRMTRQNAPVHRALRPGGRHYWEIYQAWQIEKKGNLVRICKVSFFDLGVSRKSLTPWHFLAIFERFFSAHRARLFKRERSF